MAGPDPCLPSVRQRDSRGAAGLSLRGRVRPRLITTYPAEMDVMGWLGTNGPLVVWLVVLSFVFLECAFVVGLFLPGDSLLFTAGLVLSQNGHAEQAWGLSIAATVVAVVGNQLGYHIGRRAGTTLIARVGGRMLTAERLARAREFLDRRGFWAVVLARWIPW